MLTLRSNTLLHFDTVLPNLIAIVQKHPPFEACGAKACVIRDIKGRLRLALEVEKEITCQQLEKDRLEGALRGSLQSWFHGPVLSTCCDEKIPRKNLASQLFQEAKKKDPTWPHHWPKEVSDALGESKQIDLERWFALQRVQSKETWIARHSAKLPWDIQQGFPVIVSFYSFKGGVGRTTCMGILACQLARQGKKVICIDLDIEAPGVASLFGQKAELGLIDYLLSFWPTESSATLKPDDIIKKIDGYDENLLMISAGQINISYIEKLARLDFLSGSDLAGEDESPVALAIKNLFHALKGQRKPDYIFLDCRPGFNDIGGLGLHDLAHVEVIVARDNEQNLRGLEVILQLQKNRREERDRRICIVHSLASEDAETRKIQHRRFRKKLYNLFSEWMYEEEAGAEEDEQLSHFPWTIRRDLRIENSSSLLDKDVGLFLDPRSSEEGDYWALRHRLLSLCEIKNEGDLSND
jgi:cellulose biosynthesis protein BcsQ